MGSDDPVGRGAHRASEGITRLIHNLGLEREVFEACLPRVKLMPAHSSPGWARSGPPPEVDSAEALAVTGIAPAVRVRVGGQRMRVAYVEQTHTLYVSNVACMRPEVAHPVVLALGAALAAASTLGLATADVLRALGWDGGEVTDRAAKGSAMEACQRDRGPTLAEIRAHADAWPLGFGYGLWMLVRPGRPPELVQLRHAQEGRPAGMWTALSPQGWPVAWPVVSGAAAVPQDAREGGE